MGGILSGLMFLIGLLMIYTTLWYPRIVFAMFRGTLSIHQWRFSPKPYLVFDRNEIEEFEVVPDSLQDIEPDAEVPLPAGDVPDISEEDGFVFYMRTHDGIRVPLCRILKFEDVKRLAEQFSDASGKPVRMP